VQPSNEQVRVAIESLRQDAAMWTGMASELREAGRVADRLDLQALHFSYIADKLGMTELYHDLQNLMGQYLAQGAENFDSLAQALRSAADGYEEDERNAVHRIRTIY
jgi:hypothetical protein